MRMPPSTRRSAWALFIAGLLSCAPVLVSGQGAKQQPPVLTAFTINGGADTVSSSDASLTLTHTLVGARPSEYRVSHRADFAGARWMAYTPPLSIRNWYDGSGATCAALSTSHASHRVTLYLQVRAKVGDELRIVDGQRQLVPSNVESNVLRASICANTANSANPTGAPPTLGPAKGPLP
jgi:hypothetical protein